MDYLLLENLDLLVFTPAGFHPLYYLKTKNLVSTFTEREHYLHFKAFLEKTFFYFWSVREKIFLLLSSLSIPPSLGLV